MHLTPLPTTYSSLHRSAGTTGWGWWSQVHRPIREWIDLHSAELEADWKLAKAGKQIRKIDPLT